MNITKEMLEERKATLLADYHAISGALQQVDWTLEMLEQEEAEEAEVVEVTD
jgi:hypothetical protein